RRHVARLGRAQEAEAVGQDLEDAVAEDLLAVLGALLHDREHQLLLAHAGDVLDLQRFAHLDELGDVEGFQFGEVHGVCDAGREAWGNAPAQGTGGEGAAELSRPGRTRTVRKRSGYRFAGFRGADTGRPGAIGPGARRLAVSPGRPSRAACLFADYR